MQQDGTGHKAVKQVSILAIEPQKEELDDRRERCIGNRGRKLASEQEFYWSHPNNKANIHSMGNAD